MGVSTFPGNVGELTGRGVGQEEEFSEFRKVNFVVIVVVDDSCEEFPGF